MRNLVIVASANRTSRLYPMTVLLAAGCHSPSLNISTSKASTRWPEAMCSCNIRQLARTGAGSSAVRVTSVGRSVVVQNVSGLSSSTVATSPTDSPPETSTFRVASSRKVLGKCLFQYVAKLFKAGEIVLVE